MQAAFKQLIDGGGFAALAELRSSGEIGAIGAGMNFSGLIPRFLEYCDIDFFLMAMPYTLLDQLALDEDLPLAKSGASESSSVRFSPPASWRRDRETARSMPTNQPSAKS